MVTKNNSNSRGRQSQHQPWSTMWETGSGLLSGFFLKEPLFSLKSIVHVCFISFILFSVSLETPCVLSFILHPNVLFLYLWSLTHPTFWLDTAVCPLLSLHTSDLGMWFCYNIIDYISRALLLCIQSILIFPDHLHSFYCLTLTELQSLHLYQHGLVSGYKKPFTNKIYLSSQFLHCGFLWDTALCWLLFEFLHIIKPVKSKAIHRECFLD